MIGVRYSDLEVAYLPKTREWALVLKGGYQPPWVVQGGFRTESEALDYRSEAYDDCD